MFRGGGVVYTEWHRNHEASSRLLSAAMSHLKLTSAEEAWFAINTAVVKDNAAQALCNELAPPLKDEHSAFIDSPLLPKRGKCPCALWGLGSGCPERQAVWQRDFLGKDSTHKSGSETRRRRMAKKGGGGGAKAARRGR